MTSSSSDRIRPVASKARRARASNSTGKLISWNRTTAENRAIPVITRPNDPSTRPMAKTIQAALDPKLAADPFSAASQRCSGRHDAVLVVL